MLVKEIDEELYNRIVAILGPRCVVFQDKYENDFRKVLEACLGEYKRLLRNVVTDPVHAKVIVNCSYMNRIVKSYYQGRHSTAFTQLKNILKRNGDLYFTDVFSSEVFYRMRCFDKRKGLSRKDIFHIPISQKRIIKTQRYSAPGYPCLYLGKTIYGCWEEMHRPDTEKTLISCFKSQESFKVLDLRIPTLEEFLINIDRYLLLFPFIIACGIPVKHSEDVYKPEYIVPQLLLEWIIDNNYNSEEKVLGIYYTSANRNEDFYYLDHEWDNLAIPVQDALKNKDFCMELKRLFWCTKPTCYEYELIQGNINTTGIWDDGPVRKDPSGIKSDYYLSLFSRLEEMIEIRSFDMVDTEEME